MILSLLMSWVSNNFIDLLGFGQEGASLSFNDFVWIGVFILGILTGVLTFSRFVKYLLQNHKNKTIL